MNGMPHYEHTNAESVVTIVVRTENVSILFWCFSLFEDDICLVSTPFRTRFRNFAVIKLKKYRPNDL